MSLTILSLALLALPLAKGDYTSGVASALAILRDYNDPTLITPYCQGFGTTGTVTVTNAPRTSTTTITGCETTPQPPVTSNSAYSDG
jgi:hypothetical protein